MDCVYKSFSETLVPVETRAAGLRLQRGRLWSRRLGFACPVKLKVQTGRVWVTEENDNRDYLLNEGQIFQTRSPGLLIAEALEDAVLCIQIEGGQTESMPYERSAMRLASFR